MSIQFACQSCKKQYKVSDELAGRRLRCKACQAVVQVPTIEAPAAEVPAVEAFDAESPGDAFAPPPMPLDIEAVPMPVAPPLTVSTRRGGKTPRQLQRNCPSCSSPLDAQAIVCPRCSYDTSTGRIAVDPSGKKPFNIITSFSLLRVAAGLVLIIGGSLVWTQLHPASWRTTTIDNGHQVQSSTRSAAKPFTAPTVPFVKFPSRPAPTTLDAQTVSYTMTFEGPGPGLPMQVQLLLPVGAHSLRHLPCVFIAPAGTRLIHGTQLGDGDLPELLPYVHTGFAVLAYELSGSIPNDDGGNIPYSRMREPMLQFMDADGGMANARHAVDFVLSTVQEVDPQRLFVAGHSSAATIALDVAANDRRIRGVAAYAPRCDVETEFVSAMPILNEFAENVPAFLQRISPLRHIADIDCPVLLFHADDDTRIPTSDNQEFASAMERAGKSIQFMRVPSGGHYRSMINQGIPAGISFFSLHGAGNKPVDGGLAVSGRPISRPALPQTEQPKQHWDNDPGKRDALDTEMNLDNYVMRPPSGYKFTKNGQYWNWLKDGQQGRSMLQVALRVRANADARTRQPSAIALPGASGTINGLQFRRSERVAADGTRCNYSATDGDHVIIISIIAPDADALAILESAVFTLAKKPPIP